MRPRNTATRVLAAAAARKEWAVGPCYSFKALLNGYPENPQGDATMLPTDWPILRHCFTGDWSEAQLWMDTFPKLCLGLTPLVGFPNAVPVAEVHRRIPLERLLLETDAPYFFLKCAFLASFLLWSALASDDLADRSKYAAPPDEPAGHHFPDYSLLNPSGLPWPIYCASTSSTVTSTPRAYLNSRPFDTAFSGRGSGNSIMAHLPPFGTSQGAFDVFGRTTG
ncbi:uncharacterized protein [Dermacentor albipictus]|uniref:uncharacterized protein n=1 Tax=Dermacentor albipictus TaxID=60249 RepID=UPI0038FC41F1